MRSVSLLITLLLISERVYGAPLLPLPFLRGGSTAVATRMEKKRQRKRKAGVNPVLTAAGHAKQGLGRVGGKIRRDVDALGKNVRGEWKKAMVSSQKFVTDIPSLLPRRRSLKSCKRLDEVCHTFSSVLRGNEVDMEQLLRACRAHLAFMKSGGSSLRLVAKDLESNVKKAERAYKMYTKEGRSLSSLLETERKSGIHNGNELEERSAAMGLLWIRRSLAFQLDLYASLASGNAHPRQAARDAYSRHLSPFHGWALRKVFPASLSQMPDRSIFMAKFGGIEVNELNDEYDRMIAKKLNSLVATWDPLLCSWKDEFERLGLEDTRRV